MCDIDKKSNHRGFIVIYIRCLFTIIIIVAITSLIWNTERRHIPIRNFHLRINDHNHPISNEFKDVAVNTTSSLHSSYGVGRQTPIVPHGKLIKKSLNDRSSDNNPIQVLQSYNTSNMTDDSIQNELEVNNESARNSTRRLPYYNIQEKCGADKRKKCRIKTRNPTVSPSAIPSLSPSITPTTRQPTTTYQPTETSNISTDPPSLCNKQIETKQPHSIIVKDAYNTSAISRAGVIGVGSTCNNKNNIPKSIFQQIIQYQYILNSQYWTDPIVAIDVVDVNVHHLLAKRFLDDCLFVNKSKTFHTVAISTIPLNDVVMYDACASADIIPDATCYVVNASFRVSMFMADDRGRSVLQVYEDISEIKIVKEYTKALRQIFREIDLPASGIVDVKFSNITNDESNPIDNITSDINTTTGSDVPMSQTQQETIVHRRNLYVSLTVIALILIFIIGIFIGYRRRDQIQSQLKRSKYNSKFDSTPIISNVKNQYKALVKKVQEQTPIFDMYNAVLSTTRSYDKSIGKKVSKTSSLDPAFGVESNLSATTYNNDRKNCSKYDEEHGSKHSRKQYRNVSSPIPTPPPPPPPPPHPPEPKDENIYDGDESIVTGLGTNYEVNDNKILDISDHTIIFQDPSFVSVYDVVSPASLDKMIASIQQDIGRRRNKENIVSKSKLRRFISYDDTVDL